MSAAATPKPAESVPVGVALGVLAYGLFSIHDAAIKWLVADLPIWQVLFMRSFVIVTGCVLVGRSRLLARARATPLKRALALRGAITLAAWLCYYTASRSLPLGQLTSLYFAAPLIVTLMAAPLLGERVTRNRWASVMLGFVGVLVAANPRGMSASLPALLVLIAATLWGYGIVLLRQIARMESSLLQMFYVNGLFTVATGVGMALTWRTPPLASVALAGVTAVLGGLGQYTLFEAIRHAPASVMSTVEYTALLWAFALGFVIWGDVPVLGVWIGAALIAAAGCLLVLTERRRAGHSARVVELP
ncbi:MAG TPA: DMT family transporter [Acetobacteraceae bacterium]|jgi:drug/metabolite transporter (DMT)-like permease|nr:DMT family transporter [Acetobacteraceae bacterium]